MTNKPTIEIQRLANGAGLDLPSYASAEAAGMDLRAAIDEPMILPPLQRALVPTGFAMGLPRGMEAQIRPRSGLAHKHGITVLNTPGTIDSDYRGEIKIILINLGDENYTITRNNRIAQMIIAPVIQATLNEVIELNETARGGDGFGSTGKT